MPTIGGSKSENENSGESSSSGSVEKEKKIRSFPTLRKSGRENSEKAHSSETENSTESSEEDSSFSSFLKGVSSKATHTYQATRQGGKKLMNKVKEEYKSRRQPNASNGESPGSASVDSSDSEYNIEETKSEVFARPPGMPPRSPSSPSISSTLKQSRDSQPVKHVNRPVKKTNVMIPMGQSATLRGRRSRDAEFSENSRFERARAPSRTMEDLQLDSSRKCWNCGQTMRQGGCPRCQSDLSRGSLDPRVALVPPPRPTKPPPKTSVLNTSPPLPTRPLPSSSIASMAASPSASAFGSGSGSASASGSPFASSSGSASAFVPRSASASSFASSRASHASDASSSSSDPASPSSPRKNPQLTSQGSQNFSQTSQLRSMRPLPAPRKKTPELDTTPPSTSTSTPTSTSSLSSSSEMLMYTCHHCKQEISSESPYQSYNGRSWHAECVFCTLCKLVITEDKPKWLNGNPTHPQCFADRPRCVRCNKFLSGKVYNAEGVRFHQDCFTCESCGTALTHGNFVRHDTTVYCRQCSGN